MVLSDCETDEASSDSDSLPPDSDGEGVKRMISELHGHRHKDTPARLISTRQNGAELFSEWEDAVHSGKWRWVKRTAFDPRVLALLDDPHRGVTQAHRRAAMQSVYLGIQAALTDHFNCAEIPSVRSDHVMSALFGRGTETPNPVDRHGDNRFKAYTHDELDDYLGLFRRDWDVIYGRANEQLKMMWNRGARVELRVVAIRKRGKGFGKNQAGEKVRLVGLWQEDLQVRVVPGTPSARDNERFTEWMNNGAKADELHMLHSDPE